MRQYNVNDSQPEHKFRSIQEVISTSLVGDNTYKDAPWIERIKIFLMAAEP